MADDEALSAEFALMCAPDADGAPSAELTRFVTTNSFAKEEFDADKFETANSTEWAHQPHLASFLDEPMLLNWTPSNFIGGWEVPESSVRSFLIKSRLITDHREIRLFPYHPRSWLNRARTFATLGYGELAVADAYRGRLLVESFLRSPNPASELKHDDLAAKVYLAVTSELDLDSNLKRADSIGPVTTALMDYEERLFMIMHKGLDGIRAYFDMVDLIQEACKKFPASKVFKFLLKKSELLVQVLIREQQEAGSSKKHVEKETKKGRVRKIAYPWIVPEEYTRSNKAIKKVKTRFQEMLTLSSLKAASSSAQIAPVTQEDYTKDNFGVFALCDISKGERILLDRSIYSTTNFPTGRTCFGCCKESKGRHVKMDCCKMCFCSEDCKTEAINKYHQVLCGKSFEWLLERCKVSDEQDNNMVPLLLLKVLATAVQQNAKPLKVACVGSLDAGLGKKLPSWWTLYENVIAPTKILTSLGVDVFTDTRFDAWALQMLFLRLENNKQHLNLGKRAWCSLNPLYTMFNHHCDPGADWKPISLKHGLDLDGGLDIGGALEISALRDIKKGSQIYISYVPTILPEKERHERLQYYLEKACKCSRCVRERAAAASGVEDTTDLEVLEKMRLIMGTY